MLGAINLSLKTSLIENVEAVIRGKTTVRVIKERS